MSLKTLLKKAKTGNQIRNLVGCQWNEKEVKAGNSKWVSVKDLKTFLDAIFQKDNVVLSRKQLRSIHKSATQYSRLQLKVLIDSLLKQSGM